MMDNSNKKILTVSFILAGVLSTFIVSILLDLLSVTFGFMARAMNSDLLQHGLPVGVGFLVFFLLQFNSKVISWADEVVVEIKKVVWPSKKDTFGMTTAVCIMVIISGIFIALFDFISGYVVNLMLQVN